MKLNPQLLEKYGIDEFSEEKYYKLFYENPDFDREEFNGLTVVYTGQGGFVSDGKDGIVNIRQHYCYDANGNVCIQSFSSEEEAEKEAQQMDAMGYEVFIGPGEPSINYETGELVPNPNGFGIYVKSFPKMDDFHYSI